jgi:hypothetical protein
LKIKIEVAGDVVAIDIEKAGDDAVVYGPLLNERLQQLNEPLRPIAGPANIETREPSFPDSIGDFEMHRRLGKIPPVERLSAHSLQFLRFQE